LRKVISDLLNSDLGIEVVGTAKDGKEAVERVLALEPDVITLDLVMPTIDGLEALRTIMKLHPTPVVMLSAFTKQNAIITLKCLAAGAVDFVTKPSGQVSLDLVKIKDELLHKVHSASRVNMKTMRRVVEMKPVKHSSIRIPSMEKIVAIGASTGGPTAIEKILLSLPIILPTPVIICQHMPAQFTKAFAKRLHSTSHLNVSEARDGELLESGRVYIAPGGKNLTIIKKQIGTSIKRIIKIRSAAAGNIRPNIDIMMQSVADVYGKNAVGVLLTGMGEDGVQGLSAIQKSGGSTIVQDKTSSVVFGKAKKAIAVGVVGEVLPLHKIGPKIVEFLTKKVK